MEQERIYEWIKDKLEQGYDPEIIKRILKENGYDPTIVDETLKPREKPPENIIKKDRGKFPGTFLLLGVVLAVILVGFLLFYFEFLYKLPRATVVVTNPVLTKENNVTSFLIYVDNPLLRTLHVKSITSNEQVYENNGPIIGNVNWAWNENVAKSRNHTWNSDVPPFTKTLITKFGWILSARPKKPLKEVFIFTIVTKEKINLITNATLYIR